MQKQTKVPQNRIVPRNTPLHMWKSGRGYDKVVLLIGEECRDFNNQCCDSWFSTWKKMRSQNVQIQTADESNTHIYMKKQNKTKPKTLKP